MPASSERIQAWEASDGYAMHLRLTEPTQGLKGNIVALHGIQSHSGWYGESSRQLAEAGYAVHFLDRRGSGLNFQGRGDAPSWKRLVSDVAEYVRELKPQSAEPVFLMAGSWGGKVAAAAALEVEEELAGLILWCPGFYPKVGPSARQRGRIGLARAVRPGKRFPIPLSDPALFTADSERQAFIAADPLTLREATARLLVESVRLDRHVRRNAPKLRLPTLLLLAERDRIIDNTKTRNYFARWAGADNFVLEYPQAEHTLEFEPRPERFIADVRAWLDRRVAAPASG